MQRVINPQPEFLHGLREICTDLKIPLIFDEIAAGFRVCRGGAQVRLLVVVVMLVLILMLIWTFILMFLIGADQCWWCLCC